MARKVSGGLTGSPSVGALNVAPTAVVTAADDQNITLSPAGTGMLMITANAQLQAQADLRFADSDSSNWVAFQAPETVSSNVTWTLPAADGTNGQFLSTNASGTLSWASGSLALSDQTASASTHYLLITTATSGTVTAANVSSTKLSFQPSTGALTVAAITGYAAAVTLTQDDSTNATNYPLFASALTGNLSPRTDSGYTYNPSTGTLTAVILTASSDERVKENIETLTDALSKTLAMRGVIYNRIGSTRREIGLIAQELEKIAPELVTTDENGMKSIAYGNTIGLLVEAIKDQQTQIEELKGRLA
jgi:hypothetical protein